MSPTRSFIVYDDMKDPAKGGMDVSLWHITSGEEKRLDAKCYTQMMLSVLPTHRALIAESRHSLTGNLYE